MALGTLMPRLPFPIPTGHRTVLALTCTRCGELKPGAMFERRPRLPGAPAYLDRRCQPCRWWRMEQINARR
jgi:RNase P subunit RPR2